MYHHIGKVFPILLLFSVSISNAQQYDEDSLRAIWNDSKKHDTTRLKAADKIVNKYNSTFDTSGLLLLDQMQIMAERTHDLKWAGKIFKRKADFYVAINANLVEENIFKAIKIFQEIQDSLSLSGAYVRLGSYYWTAGKFPEAIELFQQQIKFYLNKKKYKSDLGRLYVNTGLIYWEIKELNKALQCEFEAYKIAKDLKNSNILSASCNNIALIYNDMKRYHDALFYNDMAMKIAESTNNKIALGWDYYTYGLIYFNLKDIPNSKSNYIKSINNRKEINDLLLTDSYEGLGNLYLFEKEFDSALFFCKKGFELANLTGRLNSIERNCKCIYNAYYELNDFKNAAAYFTEYLILKDSVNKKQNIAEISRLEMNFEFEKQNLQTNLEHDMYD